MWTWVVIVVCYGFSIFAFRLLGGVNSAADGIAGWARAHTRRKLDRGEGGEYLSELGRITGARRPQPPA
jgi:hypothetical protein